MALLAAAILLTALQGCALIGMVSTEPQEEAVQSEYQNTYNGYKDYEIGTYERLRAQDILEDYGFTDYTLDGQKRHYHNSAEDFLAITELDETYLYALYTICDEETFNVFLEVLGYESLADYLTQMDYVDSEGEPSLLAWCIADMEQISKIMAEASQK